MFVGADPASWERSENSVDQRCVIIAEKIWLNIEEPG